MAMLLEVKNVSKTYQGKAGAVAALNDVSLDVDAGEFVAVHGPSGCGKSTLLLTSGALLAPDSGTVSLLGEDPYRQSPNERAALRGRTMGFVFQQFHLVPYLSVIDNVLAPALALEEHTGPIRDRARELIDHFGLAPRQDHVPSELSSGERQRTALARALLNGPKLLFADEPTGNLDHESAETVLRHLAEFAEKGGAVLLVTHDHRAVPFATKRIFLRDGRRVEE